MLLGVDLETARAAIGIGIADFNPTVATRKSKPAQLSAGARSVLPRSLALATAEQARQIKTKHLLLALLEREQPDPAAVLLARLQIDRSDVPTKAAKL